LIVSLDPTTVPPGFVCLLAGNDEHEELEALFARDGIEVLGVAQTGAEALKILQERPTTVVVVDSGLADLDWLEVARRATEIVRRQTVVVLHAGAADSRTAAQGLDAGARGIVLKSASHSNLLEAISRTAAGGIYVDPALR
jgi:DNA-binding NarL/FixJ family response regulator